MHHRLQQLNSETFTSSSPSMQFHSIMEKMIDAKAVESGSVKFCFKINVQTLKLICHAVCLYKQASLPLFYICFVFSVIFPQF